MSILKEFSRFADSYNRINIIQKDVARELVKQLDREYNSILDIGCGGGEIYKNIIKSGIEFKNLKAIDISSNMIDIHPEDDRVELQVMSFDDKRLLENRYDIVISSSALQWSEDLDYTLNNISKLSNRFIFGIFTANTFKSVHKLANIESPIYKKEYLIKKIDRYFNASYRTLSYKLYFENSYDMLKYIKESGVNGGGKKLSFREIKNIINNYPYRYLEFEILIVEVK
ncbi:putative methyl transferase [hydrothermal vent metagenome]|uniref:Putative methyl transferase n=1 Tax=hydrothermal vent metagenome TaxID=652676 RepID=A0A1W1EK70_9ZZZZ